MEEITTAPDPLILFVSGNVARNGEKATFRYLLPWSGGDDSAGLFLFQLNPFHEVFRGNGTRPGWVLEREELIFGERYNGVVLVLAEDLKTGSSISRFLRVDRKANVQGNTVERGLAGKDGGRRD